MDGENLKPEELGKQIQIEAEAIKSAPQVKSQPVAIFRCHFCGAVRPFSEAHRVASPGGRLVRLAGHCCVPGRTTSYGD